MKRLDLLLVNAPSRAQVYGNISELSAIEPPVWAGLIARYCTMRGFKVGILDAEAEGLGVVETAARIILAQPRLAAFCVYGHQPSASTQCLPAASAVAKIISEDWKGRALLGVSGGIPTIALGTHPSALPERTLREEPFDFVCQGEGPRTIDELLFCLTTGADPARRIAGLWARNDQPFRGAENITDLDRDLPGQALELFDLKRYRAHNWHLWTGDPAGGYASVQTSLSCSFRCSFCCIAAPFGGSGQGYRKWSPGRVAAQIFELVDKHGITNIKIPDEMFCLDRSHVWQICNMLMDMGLGDKLNMWAYARVDTVKDDNMLERMRRAGFRWLGIGVESASKHVRDGVEKGRFGNEQIIEAIGRVRSHGICVGANYIFGLPDDTRESCAETLELAKHLNTEWANFYCAMAYPGSALHNLAGDKGWKLPEDPGGPGWIGYSQHAPESLPLRTEALTSEEVLDIRDDAFVDYFTAPDYCQMIYRRFGQGVVDQIGRMTALGKPSRKHRVAL